VILEHENVILERFLPALMSACLGYMRRREINERRAGAIQFGSVMRQSREL
jgi:hypothetical protein